MKIRHIIGSALLILCICLSAKAQTVQYVTLESGNYAVHTNHIITLVGYDWIHRPNVTGLFPDGTTTSLNPFSIYSIGGTSPGFTTVSSGGVTSYGFSPPSYLPLSSLTTQIVTGLASISVTGPSATFKIETPCTATVISNYVPADAIVIPTSATGNFQIILESSADLVNWTAASPGIYGASSATNRFFRVRAALIP